MAAGTVVMGSKPLFLEGADDTFQYHALDLRALLDTMNEGVFEVGDFNVNERAAGGPNMSVDVNGGTAVIQGNSPAGSRSYLVADDNEVAANVTLDPAPGSNSRIDLIVAQVRDAAVGGGSNRDWVIKAVSGVAAASPVAPAVPTNSIELAQVLVSSTTTAVTDSLITDRRFHSPRHARTVTGVPAQIYEGQLVSEMATGDVFRGITGVARSIFSSLIKRATSVGATLFGGIPPSFGTYKFTYDTVAVTFDGSNGRGMLELDEHFSGILFFTIITIGNGKTYSVSRRTSGDSITGDQIPITAIEHSPFGNKFASGDVTVTFAVFGW